MVAYTLSFRSYLIVKCSSSEAYVEKPRALQTVDGATMIRWCSSLMCKKGTTFTGEE